MRRLIVLFVAVLAMVATFITPAGARPPENLGDANQKVTICHATRSLTNPYVVITIDEAAWQGTGPRAHGDNHDREKNRFEWTDVYVGEGEIDFPVEACGEPTQDPSFVCAGTTFLYGANFPGGQLFETGPTRAIAEPFDQIPAGEYTVTLASWDSSHPETGIQIWEQDHEIWLAQFGESDTDPRSDLSLDLLSADNGVGDPLFSPGGVITIGDTSTISAIHRSDDTVLGLDGGRDSVIPVCVGLDPYEEPSAG